MVESTKATNPKDEVGEVEVVQLGKIKNTVSPFLNQKKSWDDYEELEKAPELKKGLIEELKFSKPSYI